ncbi:conserved hypothetical protein [uncultured Desulfobacterium sp.]|uniref:Uncharacterized protein n=1 Tax=uncultured Desulfobacterium sp. TaxID=201089 RepID=A0A445N444_9BACT|nr:conserved hypothetical protein [uncultured Desulfobacterium sp.]
MIARYRQLWKKSPVKSLYDAVIIEGSLHGLVAAYCLAKDHGIKDIAVFICNDLRHPCVPYLGVSQKAGIFLFIFSSSQGSMGTAFSNLEDPLSEENLHPYRFWGGSEILDPFGKHLVKAKMYEEGQIVGELSRELLRKKKILLPYLRNADPYFTHRELQRILFERKQTNI